MAGEQPDGAENHYRRAPRNQHREQPCGQAAPGWRRHIISGRRRVLRRLLRRISILRRRLRRISILRRRLRRRSLRLILWRRRCWWRWGPRLGRGNGRRLGCLRRSFHAVRAIGVSRRNFLSALRADPREHDESSFLVYGGYPDERVHAARGFLVSAKGMEFRAAHGAMSTDVNALNWDSNICELPPVLLRQIQVRPAL